MTNQEWEAAHKKAEEYTTISYNKSSSEWFKIIDVYYTSLVSIRASNIVTELDVIYNNLMSSL